MVGVSFGGYTASRLIVPYHPRSRHTRSSEKESTHLSHPAPPSLSQVVWDTTREPSCASSLPPYLTQARPKVFATLDAAQRHDVLEGLCSTHCGQVSDLPPLCVE